MKEYVYYPGFEVRDEVWLKFALLYIEKLRPIIPVSGDSHLSETYRMLVEETNLITPHRPDDTDTFRSSERIVAYLNKLIENPYGYRELFGRGNVVSEWQNKECHTYKLFRGKFTYNFERLCLDNELATRHDDGLLMSPRLGTYYMCHLAQSVATAKNLAAITDYAYLDKLSTFSDHNASSVKDNRKFTFAQNVINLQLPAQLADIPIADIIHLRNNDSYLQTLRAFHNQLELYLNEIGDGLPQENTFKEFLRIRGEVTDYLASPGLGLVTASLAVWVVLGNTLFMETFLNNMVAPAGVAGANAIISFRKVREGTRGKRHAKKFLSNLAGVRRAG